MMSDELTWGLDPEELKAWRGQVSRWKPIATAPTDGAPVLVRPGVDRTVTVGRKCLYNEYWSDLLTAEVGGGCECCGSYVEYTPLYPTQWMPLPDA